MARNKPQRLAAGPGPKIAGSQIVFEVLPEARYCHPEGDKQIGGGGNFPLTAREAKKWCKTHGVDPKSIAQYFNP